MPTNPTPRSLLTPLLLASLLPSSVALADDPLRCSFSSGGGSSNPPSGRIEVTIHSLDLNDDMEIDVWPFDNRADVYGVIDINADGTNEDFHLPEISGSDFPHWTEGNKFVSRPATPGVPVRVVIHMREADLQFSDIIDTSPDPAKEDLEFFIDTCSLRITGDITGSMGALPPIRSGNGSNQGTLVIEVGIEGERPLSNTPNDVALSGFDLIQVVPNAGRMVATKPAVALMTVANNAPVSTNVSARVRIRRTGSSVDMYDVTESLGSFAPGEVRSTYVGQSSPFIPPSARCGSYEIDASATLILEPNFEPPVFRPECWTINNSVGLARALVVEPKIPSLLWQPVGFVFDNGATASPAEVAAIREVGLPIIRGTYPLGNITDSVSMIPFTFNPGPSLPVFEALLGFLGLAIEAAHPFSLVFELNVAAAMSGFDRVMGVLPRDWFNNPIFGLWEGTTGLSLGEWLPRAVIFEAESSNDDGTNVGPKPSLPAHELGHTFGLSVDPTIKGWPCSISGNLGIIACGMFGGFDEYNSDTHSDGVPTWASGCRRERFRRASSPVSSAIPPV